MCKIIGNFDYKNWFYKKYFVLIDIKKKRTYEIISLKNFFILSNRINYF